MDMALKVSKLTAGYDGNVILSDVSFEIEANEIVFVLGKSGCGKSTLLNQVLGLETPMSGDVTYFGVTTSLGVDLIPREARLRCGVLFQNGALLSSLTLAENVALPLRMHRPELPMKVVNQIVAQKLESVTMLDAWSKMPSELSGGMIKRAGLARALVMEPDLLFCDEPTAGLDPEMARSLSSLLLKLREKHGIAMMVISHDLEFIRETSDSILFLSHGKVIFKGTLEQALMDHHEDIRLYFQKAEVAIVSDIPCVPFVIEENENGNH